MQHEKLNKPNNPCEEVLDYSYLSCIYAKIIQEIGCKPYWTDFVETDFPNCNNITKLSQFIKTFTESLGIMEDSVMLDKFNCLRPCNYMEYRVRLLDIDK